MTTAELPAGATELTGSPLVLRARKIRKRCAQAVHDAVRKGRAWRLHMAVPALAGAGLVSAGFAARFGVWAGLIAAGVFCLRIDYRL